MTMEYVEVYIIIIKVSSSSNKCIKCKLSESHLNDDVMKWKLFPLHWPFVRGIHWSSVVSTHKCTVTRLEFFFDVSLSKLLSEQTSGRWFKTPWRPCGVTMWRHSKETSAWWTHLCVSAMFTVVVLFHLQFSTFIVNKIDPNVSGQYIYGYKRDKQCERRCDNNYIVLYHFRVQWWVLKLHFLSTPRYLLP